MALSDVMATGWHAAVAAGVREGGTAVVVGDGAVGLCGVLAASQLGAENVIAMSRHASRQDLARKFGATHVVEERGKEGVAAVKEILGGVGGDAVLECVGNGPSIKQAFMCARPGATVGMVGVPHGVELPLRVMFSKNIGLAGGMAPVRKLPARAARAGARPHDRPGPRLRPHAAAGPGGRRLWRDGRAPRDQGAAAALRVNGGVGGRA